MTCGGCRSVSATAPLRGFGWLEDLPRLGELPEGKGFRQPMSGTQCKGFYDDPT
jgi:hypothetical protein